MAGLSNGRPAQFLMAMFQGSGNIPPILAIARRLVACGHHVRIIAGPGLQPDRPARPVSASFLEGIRRAGATLIPLQQDQDPCAGAPPAHGLCAGWTPPSFAANVFLARRFLAAPIWAANVMAELARQPADEARPLVLVSFSTAPQGQAGALQRTLAALSTLPVRGLVTLGPALDPAQFQAPTNVVLESFVPHALVLPQVAVMVSQCGHGTVMKTLANGVPLVCLPLRGDQPDLAARVVHAGAGVRLSQDATPTQIRAALQWVLADPSFRDGARRIARAMAMEDGARAAVEEIESLVAPTGSPALPAC